MNLIVSNLLTICVLTGLLITEGTSDVSISGNDSPLSFCGLTEGATALVTTSSILSVLLIGLDQYFAVVDPLRYQTRIDKLRCGFLILGLWFIALVFGVLASFDHQPISSCRHLLLASVIVEDNGGSSIAKTYGFVYAILYATLGYLVPFLAICWIYAKIYIAARSNSERTRRTGSRPILVSTGSFSGDERPEPGATAVASVEDFRRIPKISSLSSIDENSETCTSQMNVPYPVLDPEDNKVVFTVGASNVDVNACEGDNDNAKDSAAPKVPISALKAKFLSENYPGSPGSRPGRRDSLDLVKSRFPEVPEQRRKSSHDLMYEEMMLGFGKHPYEYDDDYDFDDESSDEDEDEDEDEDHRPEAEPLSPSLDTKNVVNSSTRSISVNFDLNDTTKEAKDQEAAAVTSHPLPIVTITPPGQKTTTPISSSATTTTTTTSTSTPPLHRVPSVRSTNSYINNLKYKISNGSLFKYREETRAARISALVIVMGLICWTPYVYVLVSRNLPSASQRKLDNSLDVTALGFLVLATYISPLLFGYRSRRVKRELRKFFCFKRELSYKNNRSLMAKKVLRRRHSGATILSQFVGDTNHHHLEQSKSRYNIFNCMYGRNRWPKEKVQFVQVPDTALAVETCRSSFSSGASTQISSTSTDEC